MGETATTAGETGLAPVTDQIELLLPAARPFDGVAQLVLGGVGTRCELPYDVVDELQLAVAALLPSARGEQIALEIAVADRIVVTIGPLLEGTTGDASLRRVLDRLVESVEPLSRDGAEWIALAVRRPAPA